MLKNTQKKKNTNVEIKSIKGIMNTFGTFVTNLATEFIIKEANWIFFRFLIAKTKITIPRIINTTPRKIAIPFVVFYPPVAYSPY